jgi:putative nucleotidyltransferase with HDIG domain
MDIQNLRIQIERIDTLPTIPKVLRKLLKIIENPRASMTEISEFVSSDPVLTSRVLKVVNSPVYGFPGRISSVSQALILLGLNVVRGMLLGVSVFEVMEKAMNGLWRHSLGCAVAARVIAKKKGIKEPEEVSIAALLHDIGKVALSLKFPEDYKIIIDNTDKQSLFIFESEKNFFSVNHSDAGSWIAQRWNFPRNLIEAIEYHHKPHLSKTVPLNAAIVHFSDVLVRGLGFGFAGDHFVPPVNPASFQLIGLSDGDLKDVITELEDLLEDGDPLSPEE